MTISINGQTTSPSTATPLRRFGVVVGAAALMMGLVTGCGSDTGDKAAESTTTSSTTTSAKSGPVVTDTWARASKAGMNSAIYMSIKGGTADDALISASTDQPLAEKVEIHETVVEPSDSTGSTEAPSMGSPGGSSNGGEQGGMGGSDGSQMKKMQKVDQVEIPAGQTVAFAPGGYHVMLTNLHSDLSVGDTVGFTLTFKNAGEVKLTAEVKEM